MRVSLCFLLFVSSLFVFPGFADGKKISRIVVDAGHGGHDPGAKGKFSVEKDITLSVALRLGKILSDSMKDVEVVYTRTSDIYPTLVQRHEMANRANGDLFISIHVNSTAGRKIQQKTGYKTVKRGNKKVKVPVYKTIHIRETTAEGTETYVLGLHRNTQKENAIGEYGEHLLEEPGLLNDRDPQTAIIVNQYSQAFLSRSVFLGEKIQDAFAQQGRRNLGVKQAGWEVLAGSAMPGVLVEIGFINNPEEEVYLNTEKGQQEAALAIYKGIQAYRWEGGR